MKKNLKRHFDTPKHKINFDRHSRDIISADDDAALQLISTNELNLRKRSYEWLKANGFNQITENILNSNYQNAAIDDAIDHACKFWMTNISGAGTNCPIDALAELLAKEAAALWKPIATKKRLKVAHLPYLADMNTNDWSNLLQFMFPRGISITLPLDSESPKASEFFYRNIALVFRLFDNSAIDSRRSLRNEIQQLLRVLKEGNGPQDPLFFHGLISRAEAEQRLNEDGMVLVRIAEPRPLAVAVTIADKDTTYEATGLNIVLSIRFSNTAFLHSLLLPTKPLKDGTIDWFLSPTGNVHKSFRCMLNRTIDKLKSGALAKVLTNRARYTQLDLLKAQKCELCKNVEAN
jgi:hypothetical protein